MNCIAFPPKLVHSKLHSPSLWCVPEVALAWSMAQLQTQHEQGHPHHLMNRYHVLCWVCTVHFVTFLPLISGGADYKWCGYPSESVGCGCQFLPWPWVRRVWSCSFSWLTQLTTCYSSVLERACKYQTYVNENQNNYIYDAHMYHGINEHFKKLEVFKWSNWHLLHGDMLVIYHEPFCGVFFLCSLLNSASYQFSFLTEFLFKDTQGV